MKKISSMGKVVTTLLVTGALIAGVVGVGVVAPASATTGPGVYYATGHDLDYHCAPSGQGESLSCNELKALINHATSAATPRVLAITSDPSSKLTEALAQISGITPTSIDANTSPADYASAVFSNYDVIVTESVYGNAQGGSAPDSWVTTVNSRKADLIAFYNNGGGVVQLANGAGMSYDSNLDQEVASAAWADYYLALGFYAASVNQTNPRTVTAVGTATGLTVEMSNCCATHNAFVHPPTTMQDLELDANGIPVTVVYTAQTMPAEGIGGNTLSGTIAIDRAVGQPVLGAVVTVTGTWFKADSAFTIMVDTTPQTSCDTGSATDPANAFGAFQCGFALPALAAGPHTIVLTGLAPDGSTVTRTAYLVVDADGNIGSWGFSETVAATAEPTLALTGVNANGILTMSLLAGMLLVAGAAVFALRRRSNA